MKDTFDYPLNEMPDVVEGADSHRNQLITKLVNPLTTPEERISISRELFPEERKREILKTADKDRKGRAVRYFRIMSYEELEAVLNGNRDDLFFSEDAKKEFSRKSREIQFSLKKFLESEGVYGGLEEDFDKLCSDFTPENYRNFVQQRIPLINLLKLHQVGAFIDSTGVTGLISFSVGAPFNLPVDSSKYGQGMPMVEFHVPPSAVIVSPLSNNLPLQEREKEVNTTTIKPEWILDVYTSVQDTAERFFKDPLTVTYKEYQRQNEEDLLLSTMGYLGERSIFDILGRWKDAESMSDLIPEQKMTDLDGTNPKLHKPLVS